MRNRIMIKCPIPHLCKNNESCECNHEIVNEYSDKCGDIYYCAWFESERDDTLCKTCLRRNDIDACYDCEPYDNMLCLYRRDKKGGETT